VIVNVDVDEEAWLSVLPEAEALAVSAVNTAIEHLDLDAESTAIDIVLATDEEVAELNGQWRGKPKPTNVLSFPAAPGTIVPPGEPQPRGEIILASCVLGREAAEQSKPLADHFSHLVVHGFLHIMGYDHEDDLEATRMERLETEVLAQLGISNPYD
jgi:probable rRNA maturation factor